MLQIILAAMLFQAFGLIQAASSLTDGVTTIVVNDLTTYLSKHPDLKVIADLKQSEGIRGSIRYTLGERVYGEYSFFRNVKGNNIDSIINIIKPVCAKNKNIICVDFDS